MYKLCFALAFLAVAAAKPNWPLAYSSYPVDHQPYVASYPNAYSTAYSAPVYPVPAYSPYRAYSAAVPASYTNVVAAPVVKPVVTAPVAPISPVAPVAAAPISVAAPAYASTYPAVAPVASVYESPAFAWKKK